MCVCVFISSFRSIYLSLLLLLSCSFLFLHSFSVFYFLSCLLSPISLCCGVCVLSLSPSLSPCFLLPPLLPLLPSPPCLLPSLCSSIFPPHSPSLLLFLPAFTWCLVLVPCSLHRSPSSSFPSLLLQPSSCAHPAWLTPARGCPRSSPLEVLQFPWQSVFAAMHSDAETKGHASKVSINHSAISQKNKYSSERSPIQSALNQKRLEARFAVVPALDEFCHIKARREQNKDGAQQIGSREACEWHEWGWQFKTHLWFPHRSVKHERLCNSSTPQLQLLDNSFVQRYANLYASHD